MADENKSAPNVATPHGSVPSARAERLRIGRDDTAGIAAYFVMVLGVAIGITAIVALG